MPFYGMLILSIVIFAFLALPPTLELFQSVQQAYIYYSRQYALENFETDIAISNLSPNCIILSNLSKLDGFVIFNESHYCAIAISSAGLYYVLQN